MWAVLWNHNIVEIRDLNDLWDLEIKRDLNDGFGWKIEEIYQWNRKWKKFEWSMRPRNRRDLNDLWDREIDEMWMIY